ncbi:MAG: hypothetical protein WBV94_24965 [Blastocatellia bacterium]
MSMHLTIEAFNTASVQHFLHGLENDLARRKSLLVLLPTNLQPAQIWDALQERLLRRGFDNIQTLDLNHMPVQGGLAGVVGKHLQVKWPAAHTPRTVANLLMCDSLPDIIRLEGLEQLPDATKKTWLDLLQQWAQAAQNTRENISPTPLCILAPAVSLLPDIPKTNVRLAVYWWWKVLSSLELKLLCRFENGESNAISLWRENILPMLAGDDAALAEYLWDYLKLEPPDLMERLRKFAQDRGWTIELLRAWKVEQFFSTKFYFNHGNASNPPESILSLWGHGVTHCTPEHGLELHTAALALLGRKEDLLHRLWRGQTALLLPMINSLRLKICEHLTKVYDNQWPIRWWQPESPEEIRAVTNDPFACQWGHLRNLLNSCGNLQHERRWARLADLSHRIRNELAHYRPISFLDFELFWQELRKAAS